MSGVLVSKPKLRRFGNHAHGFLDAYILCELRFIGFCWRIHHQARLCDRAMLKSSGEGLLAGTLDKKVKNDLGERGI